MSTTKLEGKLKTKNESIYIGEVLYRIISLEACPFWRKPLTIIIEKKALVFFVSNSDFKKAWPESPSKMKDNGYTLRVKLKGTPNKWFKSQILSIEKIIKEPKIVKSGFGEFL